MDKPEKKSFDSPDETRTFSNGKLDLVTVGGLTIGRATFEPGWKWSNDVKPIVKTDRCEVLHKAHFISGRMHVVMDDGTELEFGPGDVGIIPPGHDAWIVGDEPCVAVDISPESGDYAKPTEER